MESREVCDARLEPRLLVRVGNGFVRPPVANGARCSRPLGRAGGREAMARSKFHCSRLRRSDDLAALWLLLLLPEADQNKTP